MMSSKLSFAIAMAVASSSAAQAKNDERGPYIAIGAGVAKVDDLRVTYYDAGGTFGGTGTRDTAVTDAKFKSAAAFKGAFGYDFGTLRADVEVDYERNRLKGLAIRSINGSAITLAPADIADICDYLEADSCSGSGNTINIRGSRLRQLSALLNAWVDIPVGDVVTPYLGGGAGAVGYELDGEGKVRFAWQLGGGLAVNVSNSVALTADVRYRQGSGVTITDGPSAGVIIGKVKTTSFGAGLRVRF